MAGSRRTANNVLAGLFVVLSVLGGVAIVVVLAGLGDRLTPRDRYVVHFTLEDGAEGLDIGSPVTIAGRDVGWVDKIELVLQEKGEKKAGVYATILVDRRHAFHGRPRAALVRRCWARERR